MNVTWSLPPPSPLSSSTLSLRLLSSASSFIARASILVPLLVLAASQFFILSPRPLLRSSELKQLIAPRSIFFKALRASLDSRSTLDRSVSNFCFFFPFPSSTTPIPFGLIIRSVGFYYSLDALVLLAIACSIVSPGTPPPPSSFHTRYTPLSTATASHAHLALSPCLCIPLYIFLILFLLLTIFSSNFIRSDFVAVSGTGSPVPSLAARVVHPTLRTYRYIQQFQRASFCYKRRYLIARPDVPPFSIRPSLFAKGVARTQSLCAPKILSTKASSHHRRSRSRCPPSQVVSRATDSPPEQASSRCEHDHPRDASASKS